ncbi:hypothetical protein F751_5799 [Auxenochlorella protothecoides]|uniref:Uncharacterized protein n=1 Tax=Auxenochlorella protothecoides TaxID=3075 RepID=A0A087SUF7_AUXPR|nr:hypothetical protein F751_5799 [Auxenochlorella protothecoides]KFM29361.1 hypothetical protein F751_5799 [Auxenochlorella protothecoides]
MHTPRAPGPGGVASRGRMGVPGRLQPAPCPAGPPARSWMRRPQIRGGEHGQGRSERRGRVLGPGWDHHPPMRWKTPHLSPPGPSEAVPEVGGPFRELPLQPTTALRGRTR